MKQIIITVFAYCLTAFISQAATRYVDNVATGANNGTSWANAWTSLTAITGLVAGDTVFISGGSSGKTYNISNWQPRGGASGNPITYRVGQDPSHNGMVTFGATGTQFLNGNLTDVTINGEVSGQSRMTVSPGFEYTVYNPIPGTSRRFKLLWVNFSSLIFAYIDEMELAYCVGTTPISGLDDSFIAHIGEGGLVSGWGVNSIHHNKFTCWRRKTSGEGWDCIKWGGNFDVYNNVFLSVYNAAYNGHQHGDGMQVSGRFVRVFNNYFENWISYPILDEVFGSGSDWQIFNNVFYSGNESGIDWTAHFAIALGFNPSNPGTMTNYLVSNNTVIGNGLGSKGIALNHNNLGTSGSSNRLVNNIVYNSGNGVLSGIGAVNSNNAVGTSGLVFVNNSIYPTGDFHLTSGATAAIDLGVEPEPSYLTSVYISDAGGAARGAVWDIGAYEFQSAPTPTPTPTPSPTPSPTPRPPANLRIQ